MKKSTILVVALVYIISFIVVGLFGLSMRAVDKIIYVDEIKISCPQMKEQGVEDNTNYDQVISEENPYFTYRYRVGFKEGGTTVQLKAEVTPSNATYPNIKTSDVSGQTIFTVDIENIYYINIKFNEPGTAKFFVESTDGSNYRVAIQIRARL